jgi:hypothetical protein
MADEYHIIIESPREGFSHQKAYTATLEKLKSQGWDYRGGVKSYRLTAGLLTRGDVVDEAGKVVEGEFADWDVGGNDAWVSLLAYPASKKVRILGE